MAKAKEVQMSIKMKPDLRDRFMAVAADPHRPAAQSSVTFGPGKLS